MQDKQLIIIPKIILELVHFHILYFALALNQNKYNAAYEKKLSIFFE
jgi:hypothetical protein